MQPSYREHRIWGAFNSDVSNRLAGDRSGQYSIRINEQYRICFLWSDAGPDQVEITDYH